MSGHAGSLAVEQAIGVRSPFDFATGYPRLSLSGALQACVAERSSWAVGLDSRRVDVARRALAGELHDAVCSYFELDDACIGIHPTFSGSVAIQRVYAAISRAADSNGWSGVDVLVVEPGIDLFRQLAPRDSRFRLVPIVADGADWVEMVACKVRALQSSSGRKVFVVLESPRNPLGAFLSEREFEVIAACCSASEATLIVDHCFLHAGVHASRSVPAIWDRGRPCQWIALWDTGKTLDLNGDKIAFVLSSDEESRSWLASSIASIQIEMPIRTLAIFGAILRHREVAAYTGRLRVACRENLRVLKDALALEWAVAEPRAGPFACAYALSASVSVPDACGAFRDAGVGLATSYSFFSEPHMGSSRPFLRVALSREPDRFAAGAQALARTLSS